MSAFVIDKWTGLDANMTLEIKAETFRVMTGHMAPFKSAAPASYPASEDERSAAYQRWSDQYRECVRAVMHAFNEMRPRYQEEP